MMQYAETILSNGVKFWGTVLLLVIIGLIWWVISGICLLVLIKFTKYCPPHPNRDDGAMTVELIKMPIIVLQYLFGFRRDS